LPQLYSWGNQKYY
jgi:hypothetical protein